MRGVNAQRTQHVGDRQEAPGLRRITGRATRPGRAGEYARSDFLLLREARKTKRDEVYRRRRFMAVSLLVLGAVALVFAVFVQTKAAEVSISTPIRPASLTGLGYHPEGESLATMEPRGKNLSANAFVGLFSRGETQERIRYYVMDSAGRDGPQTGAIDVGATTGTAVYAPVTGAVTAIRPDPMVQNANIIEIKP